MRVKTAIVIGGGIAGCSTAYALAQRGIKVRLVEQHENLGSGASGNPCAMLYPRVSGNDALSSFALASFLYSLDFYQSLQLPATAFNTCGMLQTGYNSRELARITKVAAFLNTNPSLKVASKLVNPIEASQIAGVSIDHAALYFSQAGWVNPSALLARLTQHAHISIMTSCKIALIKNTGALWQVIDIQQKTLAADIVVIANANNAMHLLQSQHISTQPVRGQVTLLAACADSRALNTILCSDGYFSPAMDGVHSLGATFDAGQSDLSIREADHQKNLSALNTLSSALCQDLASRIQSGRASLRCVSTDYFPIVGKLIDADLLRQSPPHPNEDINSLPWLDGLYINTGHGSKGFTSAPWCAELLAQRICGETASNDNVLLGAMNPNRFLLKRLGLKRLAKMA